MPPWLLFVGGGAVVLWLLRQSDSKPPAVPTPEVAPGDAALAGPPPLPQTQAVSVPSAVIAPAVQGPSPTALRCTSNAGIAASAHLPLCSGAAAVTPVVVNKPNPLPNASVLPGVGTVVTLPTLPPKSITSPVLAPVAATVVRSDIATGFTRPGIVNPLNLFQRPAMLPAQTFAVPPSSAPSAGVTIVGTPTKSTGGLFIL